MPFIQLTEVINTIKTILADTNEKVVVVSQWTATLELIGMYLRHDGIPFMELNGKTPIKSRFSTIKMFNSKQNDIKVKAAKTHFLKYFMLYI